MVFGPYKVGNGSLYVCMYVCVCGNGSETFADSRGRVSRTSTLEEKRSAVEQCRSSAFSWRKNKGRKKEES